MNTYHVPVLFYESIDGLEIKPDGIYVDCTFGGGGHSQGILDKLASDGKLVAFDQDVDAQQNLPKDDRLVFIPQNFRHLQRFLRLHGIEKIDGLLADLGVSSFQFDEGERGFSTRFEGPLDMRMDRRQQKTAAMVIKEYGELQLHKMFEQYGEVTNAKTLARNIVTQRSIMPAATIRDFKAMVHPVVKGNPHKYFAQVFQALRIEVNGELDALRELLEQACGLMNERGRIAIITFHSIEDRIVKNFFRQGSFESEADNPFTTTRRENSLRVITKKPVVPSEEEIKTNARSRSAKLRIAEKI